jgi:hypothetical protein
MKYHDKLSKEDLNSQHGQKWKLLHHTCAFQTECTFHATEHLYLFHTKRMDERKKVSVDDLTSLAALDPFSQQLTQISV